MIYSSVYVVSLFLVVFCCSVILSKYIPFPPLFRFVVECVLSVSIFVFVLFSPFFPRFILFCYNYLYYYTYELIVKLFRVSECALLPFCFSLFVHFIGIQHCVSTRTVNKLPPFFFLLLPWICVSSLLRPLSRFRFCFRFCSAQITVALFVFRLFLCFCFCMIVFFVCFACFLW